VQKLFGKYPVVSRGVAEGSGGKLIAVLEYFKKQGPTELKIIRQCLKDGRPYPQAIKDAPILDPANVFYYNAYQTLGTCRHFESGRVPWTAVKAYAEHYDLSEDQFEMLFGICQEIDEYLLTAAKNGNPTTSSVPTREDKHGIGSRR
jgi:hypothetical protein